MPMFNTNLYSNDGSVLYGNDGNYDFGFTITINKNSVGTGFSYAENGATVDGGNLNLPFDILGLTLTKGKQTPDDGLYVGDTDSQYDGNKSGELNLYVVPVPNIKTVSSDNLARFKAKCDETYQKKGSGGITNAEVIEYAETLPTASETSPVFVQTPDGTLYRKKATESDSLLGTWVINETNNGIATNKAYNISFTSNSSSYNSMSGSSNFVPGDNSIKYGATTVYTQTTGWSNASYRTIQITDISSLANVDEFTQWLTANATKTGGGASVSYEYVAMQEVPTPTTADNGKVLGVTNGAYALQEAGGGGNGKYEQITNGGVHDEGANTITFTYNGDLSIYGEFFVTGSSSDGDGTTFLAMSAYIPFITGNSMVVPVEYSKFKNFMNNPTEKGTLYGIASVSKSSFELTVYDVPPAPDGVFGPGFYLYGKK